MTGHPLPVLILLLASPVAPAAEPLTFEQHVRPILKAYCLDCHGAEEKPKGKLDLRLRRLIVAGGRKGPGLVPGKPAESLLLERMKSGDMPPGEKKVPREQIAVVERWIAGGAPSPGATSRPACRTASTSPRRTAPTGSSSRFARRPRR